MSATVRQFDHAPFQRTATARVCAVSEGAVAVDSTVFYPCGGGQPGDTGTMQTDSGRMLNVTDTVKGEHGLIWHRIDGPCPRVGEEVTLDIDWERRYRLMQMHTALHLLSVAVPYPVTGGQMTPDKGRLDFDVAGEALDKAAITAQINAWRADDLPVSTEWIDRAELEANPQLVKTVGAMPPSDSGTVRLVRIGEIDRQPCGGTHVASTGEIAPLEVKSIKNRGAHNRRITLVWQEATGGVS
ncbi:alanyl-tRNA editing protein [Larsenimonas rhizosphaerae]|uniref:Alanine--tRNA ligase n=1 Tax=Larsenimonas rhizosphaerae TaxID=2944682 RepID=A0AA42CYM5_9GAMM|nr:alanyl-tRNA editing protein [Larsenimonas rhizosphaerae]MCM2131334.1 alanyl-tRNA editing protein [Larsenimonas rhizosphaerae]MCX2525305.1 alanyl-tRNA editing protein [Larsenimonas rhizosphaerae]